MSERIFIGVAWPYANGPLHLGHVAGAYLPADIFARYHRIKGNEVLMVSGSDQHGTPITIKAEQEGKTPGEIADHYHQSFWNPGRSWAFPSTCLPAPSTANHAEVAQDIFLTLLKKGYIYKDTVSQPYCPKCQRFLPDRYVEGTCPFCKTPGARGDQCEQCGKPMNPAELIEPHCRICGTTPVFKESEHFFLKLSAFQDRLLEWVKATDPLAANVLNFTLRYLEEGLKDRAITRDIEWGIPVPLTGFENKRIYVWFEAVIGYLSASKEWAKSAAMTEKWRAFWQGDGEELLFYRQGQYPFPYHHLAGHADGLRRPQSALRCAGQRVPDHRRQEALHQPQLGGLAAGLSLALRPRPAALSAFDQHAGDHRYRFFLARVRPPQQR